MLDWLTRYEAFQNDHNLGRYLLAPHNLHRLVATLALIAVDIRVFGGANILLIVVATGCLAGLALLLGREVWRGAPHAVAGSAAAVAVMLCLTPAALLDASIPINGTYLHGLRFAVWAVVVVEPPETGEGSSRRAVAALLLAMIGAFGSAIALAAVVRT